MAKKCEVHLKRMRRHSRVFLIHLFEFVFNKNGKPIKTNDMI